MSGWGVMVFGDGLDDTDPWDDISPADDPLYDWTPSEGDPEVGALPPVEGDDSVLTPVIPVATGVNLVPHSSFEADRGWLVGPGWSVPYAALAFHGSSVARIVASPGAPSELVSAAIPIDATQPYWCSVMGWMDSWTSGSGVVLLRQYDADQNLLTESSVGSYAVARQAWVRVAHHVVSQRHTGQDTLWDIRAAYARVVLRAEGSFEWRVDGVRFAVGDIDGTYAPVPNEVVPGSEVVDLPASSLDTTPPAVPVVAALSSVAAAAVDGTFVVTLRGTLVEHPGDDDYVGCDWQATAAFDLTTPDDPESARVPDFSRPLTSFQPAADAAAVFSNVLPVTRYWARACSRDALGNRSAWSAVVSSESVGDGKAPEVPGAPSLYGVLRGLVVSWDRPSDRDLAYHEVRWRLTDTSGEYAVLRTRASVVTLQPLLATEDSDGLATTGYDVQLRAVDTSGQVQTSETDTTPVPASLNAEAGWSLKSIGYPSLTKGADIAVNAITATHIKAGEVKADKLGAGVITVTTVADETNPDGISIREGPGVTASELSRWDEFGLVIWEDPDDHGVGFVRLDADGLTLEHAGATLLAVTTEGINAAALTFGTAPGGHNLIRNSGFEMNAYTAAPSSITDTDAAHWSSSRVSYDNLSENAGDLTMTSVSFA